jgi:hypothetical protein
MKYIQKTSLWILIGMCTYSCQIKEDVRVETAVSENFNQKDDLQMMVLGEKLENPYTVENMQKAWQNVKKSKTVAKRGMEEEIEITTTHLYIRFKPKNEEELTLLEKDTTLLLFDHPLDYEITEEGDFYQDPEIPEEQPTYQYTYVEWDKALPNVSYELLANLYLPYDENEEDEEEEDEEDDVLSKTTSLSLSNMAGLLEEEALKITDNLEEEEKNSIFEKCWFCRPSKWRPKGKITLWDTDVGNYIGVEGVKVRAGRWFKWRKAYTNSKGEFVFKSRFRRKVRYKMDWERYHFALRSGFWASAQKRGPYRNGDWIWQIENGERHQYYGTIFRAAYHYYFKNIKGLRRPPKNSFWKTQLRIRASREQKSSVAGVHYSGWRAFGLWSPIKIYAYGQSSQNIYATTIHELAHASHYNMDKSDFHDTESKVKESWARGVQWELTRMVYPDYKGGSTFRPQYTQVVVDMIDDSAPLNSYGSTININNGSENLNQDNVNGYTIRQIEDALKHQEKWNNWKENLIKKYDNETEENLDILFDYWN